MRTRQWDTDVCVVGGGLSGLCAALAAAREGARVVLVHDRPVYGGNASSEVRVGPIGADRCGGAPHLRETGIIEEIRLRMLAGNPDMDWALWDLLLYDMVASEPGVTGLMNAWCGQVVLDGSRIAGLRARQCTTETEHEVRAPLFIDCTGDGTVAALAGADYRVGREAQGEFDERAAPAEADRRTMGMTCAVMARREDRPHPFTPPGWAHTYPDDSDLPYGAPGHSHEVERGGRRYRYGFWWVELGGDRDAIHDTEAIKHELLRVALGVWDHIKNRGDHGAENYRLEWVQFLPGKRESRRILGDYLLTQLDCASGTVFEDTVAYGGWPMDVHDPAGFHAEAAPTVFHDTATPYTIPFRCLYSRNIENLMMAGRNISATHMALSSTRVMATCAVLGQAVGTAAALAAQRGLTPRALGRQHIDLLQQTLLAADCYLPGFRLRVPDVNRAFRLSASSGDAAVLWNGTDRAVGEAANCLELDRGGWIALEADEEHDVEALDIVLDSDLSTQIITMEYSEEYASGHLRLPDSLLSGFRVSVRRGGAWETLSVLSDNCLRYVRCPIRRPVSGVRLDAFRTVGAGAEPGVRLFRVSLR